MSVALYDSTMCTTHHITIPIHLQILSCWGKGPEALPTSATRNMNRRRRRRGIGGRRGGGRRRRGGEGGRGGGRGGGGGGGEG